MTNSPKPPGKKFSTEKYKRLQAEANAPYRGLRKTIYVVFAASGLMGAFVMLSKLAAGTNIGETLPNLGLQVGIVALMVWLFRLDQDKKEK
ncbi:DUF3493 domain-containing protein [Dactylococcopsis salina]|uniref:DUF3493 domain-containing protein n=1 Tax=Dactylococcopsis salina (strain PCC 8305) TaxID=13035 RepID=K9YR36_DACS8|nr:DUF3493 domain-containing protein [Dactylococcopsis salina]AFZ48937.1 Protein of unknown function (DUF3493) [Dactylococcopsis salina PCC 8305]